MRKLLYTFAAFASMLAVAASCQRETPVGSTPDGDLIDVSMNFTVDDGRPATKTIGDGLTANKLTFLAYDEKGNYLSQLTPMNAGYENLTSKAGTVNLKVVKGMKYKFVFIASSENAKTNYFTLSDDKKTLTLSYTAIVTAQKEDSDFFYHLEDDFAFSASGEAKGVTLKRPLAQLNVGSTAEDFTVASNSGIDTDALKTGYKLTSIPNKLNLLDGTVSGEADITLGTATRPSETLTVSSTNYAWVSMAYVLVGTGSQNTDVTLNVDMTNTGGEALSSIERAITAVPLKRNYRTNILGNIFSIDAMFNVSVDNAFEDNTNKLIGPSFASVADLNAYFATFTDNADNGNVNPEVVTLTAFEASEASAATITLPKYKATPVRIRITAAYSGMLTLEYADADADKPATVELYAPNMPGATLTGTITSTHLTILEGSHIGTSTVSTSDTTLEIRPTATVGTVKIVKGNANIQGNVENVEVLSSATAVAGTPVQVFVSKEAAIKQIELNAQSDVVVEQPKDHIDVVATEKKIAVYVKVGADNSTAKAQNGGVIYVKASVPCTVTADGTSEAEDGSAVSSTVIIDSGAAGSTVTAENGGAINLTANGNCEVTASGSSTPEDPTETPVPSSVVIDKVASGADVHTETEGDATVEPAPDADIDGDIIAYVAKIGEAKYLTIEEAVAAVKDGETIIVLTDITQDNGILFDKENISAKLDLNSKTITINSGSNVNSRAFRIDNGALEVYGGSIIAVGAGTNSSNGTGCYGAFRIEANGALNAHDLTLKNSRPWGLNVKVLGGTAILTNVNITSSYGGGIEVTEADLGAQSKKGTAVLTNCHFTQTGYFDHCSSTLSVSGGSSLTINSGSYESENYALYVFSSGGEITVNDGTFSGNKDGVAIVAAIDLNTYPSYTGGLKLKDGVYQGGYAITSPAYMEVSGGKYSVDPTAFLAAGLEANLDGDGWWVVGPAVWSGAVASDEQFNASVDATAKTVTVSSTAVLAKLAANVQAGNNYEGYKITLTKDMDLNNQEWTPIGEKGKNFAGEFDGGGHTISNLKITRAFADVDANWRIGFIGSAIGAKVHDLTIHNANVLARGEVAAAVGYNAYSVEGKPSEIYNVNVTGHVVVTAAYRGAAAICGYSNYYVHECTVNVDETSIINGFWATGGIVGFSPQSGNIKNNYSNIKVVSDYACGGIVGLIEDSVEISGNTVENTTLEASENYGIGGIIGMMNYGTGLRIKNNTVSNVVINATENVASVIGAVWADGGTGAVEISNNTLNGITINSSKGDGTAAFIGYVEENRTATITGNAIQGTINTAKPLVNDGIWAGATDAANVTASGNTMNIITNIVE